MQFNSYIFILAFLPLMIILYFLLNKYNFIAGKSILIFGSLFFYAYSNKTTLIFLSISVIINYSFTLLIRKFKWKKLFLTVPVI